MEPDASTQSTTRLAVRDSRIACRRSARWTTRHRRTVVSGSSRRPAGGGGRDGRRHGDVGHTFGGRPRRHDAAPFSRPTVTPPERPRRPLGLQGQETPGAGRPLRSAACRAIDPSLARAPPPPLPRPPGAVARSGLRSLRCSSWCPVVAPIRWGVLGNRRRRVVGSPVRGRRSVLPGRGRGRRGGPGGGGGPGPAAPGGRRRRRWPPCGRRERPARPRPGPARGRPADPRRRVRRRAG